MSLNKKKFLVYAGNLHVGGGVQVAASFIREMMFSSADLSSITVFVSSEVAVNIDIASPDIQRFKGFRILNGYRVGLFNSELNHAMDQFDVVFTIFGPLYRWNTPFKNIVGFAQPWIIYPRNDCLDSLSFFSALRSRLKYWIQGIFFKRADALIVELDHVREKLIKYLKVKSNVVTVVRNSLSSIYRNEGEWTSIEMPVPDCDLRLGFLGRNYLHKNTHIFPAIAKALAENYQIRVMFFVTFTESEWRDCTREFQSVCINVGPLSVTQCPLFYRALDGVVFPSLLECFSATPLEALAMGRPLFASDREFNHDICGKYAAYFDPLDAEDAARVIAQYYQSELSSDNYLQLARNHAFNFSSPDIRASQYLECISRVASDSI